MLGLVLIDISISFAWVGLLAYMEMIDTYRKAFPNGTSIERWIKRVTKSSD